MTKKSGVLKAQDVEIINKKTGEIVEGTWYILAPKEVDVSFCKFFMPVIAELYRDTSISKNAIRLLLYMISKLKFNSLEVIISPQVACEELNIGRATFYRWRQILLERGFITHKEGFRDVYLIKPHTIIRGSMRKISSVEISMFYNLTQ